MFLWITNSSHVSWKYWAMLDYGEIADSLISTDLIILTCSSYSVRRKTPWEDLVNKSSNLMHSTISAAPYRRQWVKMCYIFDEWIVIILFTFYAPGCLLALKVYVNGYWRSVFISTTTWFFVTLNFRIFCLTVVHPYAKQKSPSNIPSPPPFSKEL